MKVSYRVYDPKKVEEEGDDGTKLNDLRDRCVSVVKRDVERYLWNDQKFELRVKERRLEGNVSVGDCVEDEWFVVWLLFQISKKVPCVVIDVLDEDGQFLLIEAANELPEWIEPDRMTNRVFLHRGELHIIGLEHMSIESKTVSNDVLKLATSKRTLANIKIQQSIQSRLESVRTETLTHRAWCVLPIQVADVLKSRPDLVPKLANALYLMKSSTLQNKSLLQLRVTLKGFRRDAQKKKQTCKCRKIVRVTFSKFAFAKLRSCPFHAPKGCETYIPKFETDPIHGACELGLKLCAGLEILASSSSSLLRKLSDKSFKHQCQDSNFQVTREKSIMKDDDESWLSVAPQDVERMLEKYNFDEEKLAGDLYEEDEYSVFPPESSSCSSFPNAVANAMHRFVKHKNTTLDGAEVPKDDDRDEDDEDDDEVTCRDDVLMRILSGESFSSTNEISSNNNTFQVGDVAILCNLKSKSELNGKTCKILQWLGDDKKRFAVRLLEGKNNRKISVRPTNLEHRTTESLIRQMDAELVGTNIDKSFEGAALQSVRSSTKEEERTTSMNVDMNLVSSLMKSFELQHGGSGPTSNILGEMNLSIPKNSDDSS